MTVSKSLPTHPRRTRSAALLALALAASLLPGCNKGRKANPGPPPSSVITTHPVQREILEWNEYTGRLAAPDTVEVRARVTGYLESIGFKDGQQVKKGDVLFVLDSRPFRAELEQAQAALRQAEAELDLAQRNFTRSEGLRKTGAIAQQDFDSAVSSLASRKATTAAAVAAMEAARLNLDFTRVEAPVDGRVSRYYVSVGNLVTSTTLLTTVVSADPIYCYFDVDERSYLKFQEVAAEERIADGKGTEKPPVPVEMELANEQGFPRKGLLNFMDNRLSPETATIELRAAFANPQGDLTPGLFARVRIPASRRYQATLLPDKAVNTDQSDTFVYVVGADGKAAYRRVVLGPIVENLRVMRSGVTPEDRVIVSGMQSVRPGAPVQATDKPIEEVMPAEARGTEQKAAADRDAAAAPAAGGKK